jgi:hypothetical protein
VHVDDAVRAGLVRDLTDTAVGVAELSDGVVDLSVLRDELVSSFGSWPVEGGRSGD